MAQLLQEILFQTKNISLSDKQKIKAESLNDNFYYAVHGINLYVHNKWSTKFSFLLFPNIQDVCYEIGTSIINSYIEEFKKNIYPTFAHEFNILIEENFILNDFSYFIEETSNDIEWIEYFFTKYPVLLDNLDKIISFAISFALEFLSNLNNDIYDVEKKFNIISNDFTSCRVFSGDNHNNQRSVAKLQFGTKTVFYKPRNLNMEVKTYELFTFLQSLGLKESIYIPVTLTKTNYAWMAGVDYKEVVCETDLKEFYFNQGINLAVFHIIGATDLIGENIIAHGKLPCYFDLECILHPNLVNEKDINIYQTSCMAANFIQTSVLKTCLLPQYSFVTNKFQGISNSGLSVISGSIPQLNTKKDVKFIRKYEVVDFLSSNEHIPSYENKKHISSEFLTEIISGFSNTYDLIEGKKEEVKIFINSNFQGIKTRILYRPTYIYSKLINESFLPIYLNSSKKRNELFSFLKNSAFKSANNLNIINSEISQLENLDIPIFYTFSNSTDIISEDNSVISRNFFTESGIMASNNKIESMSNDDKLKQIEIIELSFCIHEGYQIKKDTFFGDDYDFHLLDDFRLLKITEIDSTTHKIEDEINTIFKKVQSKGFHKKGEYSYFGLTQTPRYTWDISHQGINLFDGTDGLSFFYLNLYKVFNNLEALNIGKKIIEKGLEQFYFHEKYYSKIQGFNKTSLFNHPISTFYVAEYYLQENVDLNYISQKDIDKILLWIEKYYLDDRDYDILGGGAGTILYLLKLYDRLREERILILSRKIASYILSKAHVFDSNKLCWLTTFGKAHTGFSHGSSGVAFSLFKLDSYLGEKKFKESAIKALNYERMLFDTEKKYWYSYKVVDKNENNTVENHFWAYGSGSILLSRMLISKYFSDELIEDEIKVAKDNLLLKGVMRNFNYSSGVFGNLDLLNDYFHFKNENFINDQMLNNINSLITDKLKHQEWACIPVGKSYKSYIELDGLFTGLAGIGNTLLNIIAYDKTYKLFK